VSIDRLTPFAIPGALSACRILADCSKPRGIVGIQRSRSTPSLFRPAFFLTIRSSIVWNICCVLPGILIEISALAPRAPSPQSRGPANHCR
jgi:hypothetical protein